MNIRFTLVAEGSTDTALLPILRWAIRSDPRIQEVEQKFAKPSDLPPVREGLASRIRAACELFPADLLFVHRDADCDLAEIRRKEVRQAVSLGAAGHHFVPVVPVRMTEAWLLIDDAAIRSAAGNPRGTVPLNLPKLGAIERIADPKEVLYTALRTASEHAGRRLKKFSPPFAASLVPERIGDFSPLRQLAAFADFENDLRLALDKLAR
jgi:hypothetical protein